MCTVLPRFLFVPVIALGLSVQYMPSCLAQALPNTNFGKFVHQPGDNQYEEKAQHERHAPPPQPRVFMSGGGGGAAAAAPARPSWVPTPAPQLPDISVQPIVADEPIRPAGFPPLPDRPDLPVASAWARAANGSAGGQGGADNGGSSGGGNSSAFNRKLQGVHEHYNHYMPGACIKQDPHPSSGGGESSSSGSGGGVNGGNAGGSHGYYKCTTPEYYGSDSGKGKGGGGANQAGPSREPGLDARRDGLQRPEAPTPMVVSQPTTEELNSQDLSLPDDDYNAQNPNTKNGKGNRFARGVGRNARQIMFRTASPIIYGGGGMMRMH